VRVVVLTRLAREERGFSLIEMLLASALLTVLLGAAIAPFIGLQKSDRVAQNANDSQDNARTTLDTLQHQLRNVAGQSQLINRASAYDLVFETVDPVAKPAGSKNDRNIMRIRYCLDTTNGVTNGRLWRQDLRWTTATVPSTMPNSATCADTTWGTSSIVADFVTNKATTTKRTAAAPLFVYYPAPSATPTTAELQAITQIRVDLFTDRKITESPLESELTTGVFLRNQNGQPTASFTATSGTAGTKQIVLNAAASSDPENLPLTYRWCDVTSTSTCDDTTKVGSGVQYTYTAPASGTRKILLQVFDLGGLETDAGPTNATAP
jgi:prepilin-type N-terminal cleavage/methylation domain-containing protein